VDSRPQRHPANHPSRLRLGRKPPLGCQSRRCLLRNRKLPRSKLCPLHPDRYDRPRLLAAVLRRRAQRPALPHNPASITQPPTAAPVSATKPKHQTTTLSPSLPYTKPTSPRKEKSRHPWAGCRAQISPAAGAELGERRDSLAVAVSFPRTYRRTLASPGNPWVSLPSTA